MDTILLLATITLVVFLLGVVWKWLRKRQRHSKRKRGNNYLYQEYNYDYHTDYHVIDSAWESTGSKVIRRETAEAHLTSSNGSAISNNEQNLDLDLDWSFNLDLDLDGEEIDTSSKEECLASKCDRDSSQDPVSTHNNDSYNSSCDSYDNSRSSHDD
ncbi:MAG: hypothetical protein QNJ70_05930 [Xenococcaceae cyanobacterium MO_207.B15]|nr:hypothetical protein [Xenococcaceae cyanobacterium MO_207.B15]